MISKETRDYIIKLNNNIYHDGIFQDYVIQSGGIDKLKKKNLDVIISEVKDKSLTISHPLFMDYYRMVSTNESGRIIKIWTWVAGLASLVSLGVSIFSLYRSITP